MHRLIPLFLFATSAAAFEDGDRCVLKAPLAITVRTGGGEVNTLAEGGTQVEVTGVGETTVRVRAGEAEGIAAAIDLEAACSGTLRMCHLKDPVVMQEHTDGTGRQFRIKAGADLSILRQGKSWGHVRISDLDGYVKTADLDTSCIGDGTQKATGKQSGASMIETAVAVDRGDGPGLLIVPFYVSGPDVSEKVADAFSQALFDELGQYRPDAVWADANILAENRPVRVNILKPVQEDAATRAAAAGLAYAVTGRLERNGDAFVLSVVVVDSKTKKVVKAVKARPTSAPNDPWAQAALAVLLPAVKAAPGSSVPKAPAPSASP